VPSTIYSLCNTEFSKLADGYNDIIDSQAAHYEDIIIEYTKQETFLEEQIDETKIEKVNKPYKKALKEYKSASLKLRPEQENAIEEYDKKKAKEERDRIDRLKRQEIEYEKYEKSMANLILK
jgi:hypothetical protein